MSRTRLVWAVGASVCTLLLPAWKAVGSAPKQPVFAAVRVAPFVIEPQPLSGAPERTDQSAFVKRLTEEATRQAEQSLLRHRIAGATRQSTPPGDAAPSGRSISGTLHLPLSLPPDVYGLRASSQKGSLATALIRVMDAGGQTIRTETASIRWRDVRWLRGARVRRNRPTDDVLADAARNVTDRAVKQLAAPMQSVP